MSSLRKICLVIVALGSYSHVCSQVKYVNEFLNIGIGARAHGMSGSVVASTVDGTATYWNPAALSDIVAPFQLNAMHSEWFGGIANFDYFSIAKRINSDKGRYLGLSLIRLGVDNIPNTINLIGPDGSVNYDRITNFSAADYAVFLSYSTHVDESRKLSLGGNVKIIRRVLGGFGGAWGFGTDFSARYRINPSWTAAAIIRDVTTTFNAWSFNLDENEKQVFRDTGNEVPISSTESSLPSLLAGVAYKYYHNNWTVLAETNLNVSTDGRQSSLFSSNNFIVDPSFGIEIGYRNKLFVRGGLGNIQRTVNPANTAESQTAFQPNVGLGLVLGRLSVDYALANVGNVSGILASHIFSLKLNFAEKSQTPSGTNP